VCVRADAFIAGVCVCVRACVRVAPSLTCAYLRAHTKTHVCPLGTNSDRLQSLWRILELDVSVHRKTGGAYICH
jgi:hypothetical protein